MTLPFKNAFLILQFDGSRYFGFQVQKGYPTVCEAFQDAVEQVLYQRWDIKGCSRTDRGVHATCYGISMVYQNNLPVRNLPYALNQYLPPDIAVLHAKEVPLTFHARYHCQSKEYTYRVLNRFTKDVFRPEQVYQFRYPKAIDAELLHQEAQAFVGTHDFSACCAAGEDREDSVRTVSSFSVERQGDEVVFRVVGDGFLYNMVRIMVGTLLHLSIGRIAPGSIPAMLASKDRLQAGFTAPAHGLYLTDLSYGEEFSLYE